MIIKDGFNKKDSDPLADYSNIGKGSHSLETELDREREGFIRSNMNNEILSDIRDPKDNSDDSDNGDNWKLFR